MSGIWQRFTACRQGFAKTAPVLRPETYNDRRRRFSWPPGEFFCKVRRSVAVSGATLKNNDKLHHPPGGDMNLQRIVAPVVLLALVSGCTINSIHHAGLDAPAYPNDGGDVALAEVASGLDNRRVGWGRLTPFAIPVAPVHVHGNPPADLMRVIEDALVVSGYSVTRPPEADAANGPPLMEARVDRYRFNNYTWFAPIIPTWGGIDVTLTMRGNDGTLLWRRRFEANGATFNFFDGYNVSSRKAVTRMGQDMVGAFGRMEFQNAVMRGNDTADE